MPLSQERLFKIIWINLLARTITREFFLTWRKMTEKGHLIQRFEKTKVYL